MNSLNLKYKVFLCGPEIQQPTAISRLKKKTGYWINTLKVQFNIKGVHCSADQGEMIERKRERKG